MKKGDYKALIMIIIASAPTDDWRAGLAELKRIVGPRLGSIIVLGCGDDVDIDVLRQISDQVLLMPDVTSDKLRAYFRWTSQPASGSADSNAESAWG